MALLTQSQSQGCEEGVLLSSQDGWVLGGTPPLHQLWAGSMWARDAAMGVSAAQLHGAALAPPDPHPAPAGTSEHDKLCRARDQCRDILKYVNEAVKQAENRHRLEGYQKRLDATSLERTSNPLAAEFKVIPAPGGQGRGGGGVPSASTFTAALSLLQSLDLTSRRMIHEGPLTWRISKDKTVGMDLSSGPAGCGPALVAF